MTETTEEKQPKPKKQRKHSRVRAAIDYTYDLQRFRVAAANRAREEASTLSEQDKRFLEQMQHGLHALEKSAVKYTKQTLKGVPIYEEWLSKQRGVGPMMAAVIIGTIDIEVASVPSKIWRYAGLDVMPGGQGRRRVKGSRLTYNPWLKTKLVKVLADSMIKGYSVDADGEYYYTTRGKNDEGEWQKVVHYWDGSPAGKADANGIPYPWRKIYDDYKHRKATQIVDPCMLCRGSGKYPVPKGWKPGMPKPETTASTVCSNCEGKGVGPWGKSGAHRDAAARRYMIKLFLVELYKVWRPLEGLPVHPSYQEEKLGHTHGQRA